MIVTLLQTDLIWENPEANRNSIAYKLSSIAQTDLIILPEMFTTGFTMNPKPFAETMKGDTVLWMQNLAATYRCAIVGSVIIQEGKIYYNRMLFVTKEGDIQYYDKRHLFTLAGEEKTYSKGNERVIVEFNGWRILLQICYDLRFPVFSRNDDDYDVAIYVANWPKPRIHAWKTLLQARAIENMAYVIGLNRIGSDGNNYEYSGNSRLIDPMGEIIVDSSDLDRKSAGKLDKKFLFEMRSKFNFLKDRDGFNLV